MKNLFAIAATLSVLITACNSKSDEEKTAATNDTTLVPEAKSNEVAEPVTGKMTLTGAAKIGQPINIKFSVYNNTDTVAKFCKWHTPFERLMSKYLDVALEDHTDVDY
ncbi:MAG: protease, partial [Chitinophagaceae bacterium]